MTSFVLLTQSIIAILKDPKLSFDNLVEQMIVYLVQNMRSKANVIVDQVNLIQFTVNSYTADLDHVNLVRKNFYWYKLKTS